MSLRSLLYVPAHSERFIAKAHLRGADAIILDLEDAVPDTAKDAARADLAASIKRVGQAGARVFVRVNADLATALQDATAASEGGAEALYVAKASVEKLARLDAALSALEASAGHAPMALIPLIEDPAGVLAASAMAAQPRVIALTTGGEDIATSLGAEPDADVLRFPKLLVHYAAKARGLLSFGLFESIADYSDQMRIAAAAREARRHGFDGASCVHPSVVALLNTAFAATPADIAWAERVLLHAALHDGEAFSLDGRMIDAPVIARARRLLNKR